MNRNGSAFFFLLLGTGLSRITPEKSASVRFSENGRSGPIPPGSALSGLLVQREKPEIPLTKSE
jgi:hypothetical protein